MIKTRFAPSPTGSLHIGSIRTALFSWIYAKKHKGEFLLRVEDTDKKRSSDENVEQIIESLKWLGISYDNQVYYQSNNIQYHRKFVKRLIEDKKAYKCYCSNERLKMIRIQQINNKIKPKYDGHCRNLEHCNEKLNISYVVRFKNPTEGKVTWEDKVKGKITINNSELDDLIIQRSDFSPTYNFCAVIDDIRMKITHVIRGDDHLSNTPRQINIYNAMKAKVPVFAHVPIILDNNKKKMSKRHDNSNVLKYRNAGYIPQALINYLMRLGWSFKDQELFSIEEIFDKFDLKDIHKSPAIFNGNKLEWFNSKYINSLKTSEIKAHVQWHCEKEKINLTAGPKLQEVIPILVKKSKTVMEIVNQAKVLYEDIKAYDIEIFNKYLNKDSIIVLQHINNKLNNLKDNEWETIDSIKYIIKDAAQELNHKNVGKIAMATRVAITCSDTSYIPIAYMIKWFGKETVLKRITHAINVLLLS